MSEVETFVEPGTRICRNGDHPKQYLEVTDWTAVGMNGCLYMTRAWKARSEANKAAWAGRSWWRKLLAIPPKGYEPAGQPTPSLFNGMFGNLFG